MVWRLLISSHKALKIRDCNSRLIIYIKLIFFTASPKTDFNVIEIFFLLMHICEECSDYHCSFVQHFLSVLKHNLLLIALAPSLHTSIYFLQLISCKIKSSMQVNVFSPVVFIFTFTKKQIFYKVFLEIISNENK